MKIETKSFMLLVLTLICITFCAKTSLATTLSVGYGQVIPKTEGLKGYVFQVELSEEFKSPWYGSVVLDGMHAKVNPSFDVDGDSASAIAISSRVTIEKRLFGSTYGSLFGGFGVITDQLPEFGDSGMVAHFGAKIKIVTTYLDVGVETWHMSDPLRHGDAGWEVCFLTLTRRF